MTKHRAVAVVLAVFLAVSPFASRGALAGGIPVIDGSNLAQAVQQVIHMVEQIEQLKNQLEVAEKELDRISGSRGMGGILHSTYDLAVTVDTDEVLETVGLKSGEDNGLVGEEAELYDEGNQNVALQLGQSQKSLEQAQRTVEAGGQGERLPGSKGHPRSSGPHRGRTGLVGEREDQTGHASGSGGGPGSRPSSTNPTGPY